MALSMHRQFETQLSIKVPFSASSGWFHRFCCRTNMRSLKFTGESAAVDKETVENFTIELGLLIQDNGYSLDQIWNVDEAGLHWKMTPNKTYVTGQTGSVPGYKSKSNRVTLLVGK